jgi:hypothetical protein
MDLMTPKFKPFVMKGIVKDTLSSGLNDFFARSGITGNMNKDQSTADFKARQAVGLQLLNWCLNGSSNESTVPPIMWGVLRGSGSVFVDGVFIGDSKANYSNGKPNKTYTANKPGDITIGFNTAYAARLHETTWTPGGVHPSKQVQNNPDLVADVGNKWVEKHLKADGDNLVGLYADMWSKFMGTK